MRKVITSILIISLFIFTSLSTMSTTGISIEKKPVNNEISSIQINEEDKTTEYWAVLVGSDPYKDMAGEEAVEDVKNLKKALCTYGWDEDNINLLTGTVSIDDIFYALSWLKCNAKSSDTVMLCLKDHGTYNEFCVYEPGANAVTGLTYEALDEKLDEISCAGMVIIISACHSGSAIPYLQDEGRVIITSCSADEVCARVFFSGVFNDFDFADYATESGDKNGVVSAEEVFEYYMGEFHDSSLNFQPQIQDDYTGQLHLVFKNWSEGIIDQIPEYTFGYNGSCNIGMTDESSNHYAAAQSFIPSLDVLTTIKLKARVMFPIEQPPKLKISIRKNLNGEDLSSAYIHCFQFEDYQTDYVTLDIPNVNVTPGETYYIVCQTYPWVGTSYPYVWLGRKSNIYDNGECYISENNGQTWSLSDQVTDLIFAVYGKSKNESLPPYVPKRPAGPTQIMRNTTYSFYVSAEDFTQDQVYYILDWNDGTNSEWLGPYTSGELVCINHSWTEEGIYSIRVKAKDEHDSESGYSDLLKVTVDDKTPWLRIIKPENALYIMNTKIRKYFVRKPLIIGKINITVDATDNESGIERVEFFIDGKLIANITSEPFTYTWTRDRIRVFRHKHTITVIAYDNAGNSASDEIIVWKFL